MRANLKFLVPFFFATLFMLNACGKREPAEVSDGRTACIAYLKKILRDPESLVIYSEKYEKPADGGGIEWYLDCGAKNGHGGMDRFDKHITTIGGFEPLDSVILIDEDDYRFVHVARDGFVKISE